MWIKKRKCYGLLVKDHGSGRDSAWQERSIIAMLSPYDGADMRIIISIHLSSEHSLLLSLTAPKIYINHLQCHDVDKFVCCPHTLSPHSGNILFSMDSLAQVA